MNNSLYPRATQALLKELLTLNTYVDDQNCIRIPVPDISFLLANQVVVEWISQPSENTHAFVRYLELLKGRFEYHIKQVNSAYAEYKNAEFKKCK